MMPPGLLGLVNLMVRSDSAETVTGAGHVAQVGALAYTAEWGMAAAGLAAQWGHNMAYTVVVADSAASAAAAGHHVVASDIRKKGICHSGIYSHYGCYGCYDCYD